MKASAVAIALGFVGLVLAAPVQAYATFHLGSSEAWTAIMEGAGTQAATWLGDIGIIPMAVIGLGLILTIMAALYRMLHK